MTVAVVVSVVVSVVVAVVVAADRQWVAHIGVVLVLHRGIRRTTHPGQGRGGRGRRRQSRAVFKLGLGRHHLPVEGAHLGAHA